MTAAAVFMLVVLLLPGVTWSLVLLGRQQVGFVERLAISVGLSVVLVPSTIFLLNLAAGLPVTILSTASVALILATFPVAYLLRSRYGQSIRWFPPGSTNESSIHPHLALLRLSVGRNRSPDTYLEFQKVQGQLILRYLGKRGVEVYGKQLVDIACGHGGYSLAFQEAGARVVALDRFLSRLHPKIRGSAQVMAADALSLPFRDNSIDFIFCASLIEHVEKPRSLLEELWRTLSLGGLCYLSFPPFYSPVGGHQFKPFHILGERMALRMYRWTHRSATPHSEDFDFAYGDWGLHPLTIRTVRRMISETGFTIVNQSTRHLCVDFSRLPFLGEVLTWHVQFLLKKVMAQPVLRCSKRNVASTPCERVGKSEGVVTLGDAATPLGVRSSFVETEVAERLRKVPPIVAAFRQAGTLANHGKRLLDIGAGSGVIGEAVATELGVTCILVDAQDHRVVQGAPFLLALGEYLPFQDETFDLVMVNHVIEHVGEQLVFLREIHRVLKPGGLCYVATPSKYALLEPHYKLPILSWLPKAAADRVVRFARRGNAYDVKPLTRQAFRELCTQAELPAFELTKSFIKRPRLYGRLGLAARFVGLLPSPVVSFLLPIISTHVWILRKTPTVWM